MLILHIRNGL